MKHLKKNLQAVSRELKVLARKTEKLTKAVEKLEKTQAVKKRKAKPKTAKRAPAKKKITARKKVLTRRKVPPKKKAAKLTATDRVLKLIKQSKKDTDVPALMKKTRYDERKVRNIVFGAFKQRKIKRVGRGAYVAA